jgi:hypothetical protein
MDESDPMYYYFTNNINLVKRYNKWMIESMKRLCLKCVCLFVCQCKTECV